MTPDFNRNGRTTVDLPDFLTRTEKGGIRITGHRIDLYHIMLLYEEGFSAEMIHLDYPTLPLALIYKVMAFYLENKAEVDAYVAEVDAESDRRMATAPRTPTVEELHARRLAAKAGPSL
jgi:uncharacterized protein (DUF433 family)